MNAVAAALSALFLDPHLSRPGLYRVQGAGSAATVRVILQAPDELHEFAGARVVVDTTIIDIRVSDASALAKGDTIEVDGVVYRMVGAPRRSADRLVWRTEAQPA